MRDTVRLIGFIGVYRQVLGKLADRLDAEIKRIQTIQVTEEADMQALDPHLCSTDSAGHKQEARTLLNSFRDQFVKWEREAGSKSIHQWELDQMKKKLSASGSHDKMRSLVCAAHRVTWETHRDALRRSGGTAELRAADKYIACCWQPMLAWLCRIKSDSLSKSTSVGVGRTIARSTNDKQSG